MAEYLAVDIGGSSIKYALVNEEEIVERGRKIQTPLDDIEEFLRILFRIYDRFADRIEGVAIAAPGRIDSRKGYFYHGGALTYLYHMDLISILQTHIGCPISIENDARCAALAELWKGSMKDVKNGIVIVIGTGVGSALIIDGKLYRGSHFSAGEAGNMVAVMNRPFYTDGTFGRFARSHALLDTYADLRGIPYGEIGGKWFFQRANRGERAAREALREYAVAVTNGILSIQALLDLEKVAIGGGFSSEPLLLDCLKKELNDSYGRIDPHFALECPELVFCEFGNDANLIGALYHHLHPEE